MSYQTLTLDVINNATAETVGKTTLNLKVKDEGANYLVHKALTIQKANSREFTSSTKTRAEVRGGGRKPWKQKGLGRARAGSNRSPLWRGGGVMFGPKPKKVKVKINKKEKNLALQTLLLNKKEQIIALDKIEITDYRTKNANELIKKLNLDQNQKILFITKQINSQFKTATRNLPSTRVTCVNQIDVEKVLRADIIVFDLEAIKYLDDKVSKQNKTK